MIGYRLSRTGRAENPLYLPVIAKNLWSVEELCWFLTSYPALIDDSLTDLRVTRWLASEFGIAETALRMERGLKKEENAAAFFTPLLSDLEYLTPQELNAFVSLLQRLQASPMALRFREKGDALFLNRRYGKAVTAYRQALEIADAQGSAFTASVHLRLGATSMQLLKYEEGFKEYSRALALSGSREILKYCLHAKRMISSKEEYERYADAKAADAALLLEIEEEAAEAESLAARSQAAKSLSAKNQSATERGSAESEAQAECAGAPALEGDCGRSSASLSEALREIETAYLTEAEN